MEKCSKFDNLLSIDIFFVLTNQFKINFEIDHFDKFHFLVYVKDVFNCKSS